MIGLLSTVASRIASAAGSSAAGSLASVARQVDATLSVGALENARSAMAERRRVVQVRHAIEKANRILEFDRSA